MQTVWHHNDIMMSYYGLLCYDEIPLFCDDLDCLEHDVAGES